MVSPNFIGALRMASEMIRPAVVAFLDSMLRSSQGKLGIHPIVVTADSPVAGKRIDASGLIDEFGLLVLGAKHPAKELEFNPNSDELLRAGMTLIVMGDIDNIARAKKVFRIRSAKSDINPDPGIRHPLYASRIVYSQRSHYR